MVVEGMGSSLRDNGGVMGATFPMWQGLKKVFLEQERQAQEFLSTGILAV